MNVSLFKKWWLVTLKGIFIVAMGALLLIAPEATAEAMIFFFGATLLAVGISLCLFGLYNRHQFADWRWFMAEGLFDFFFGALLLFYPGCVLLGASIIGGVWLLVIGIFQFLFGVRFRNKMKGWKFPVANGVLAFLLGIVIVAFPMSGVLLFSLVMGFTLLAFGVFLIVTSLRMKDHVDQLAAGSAQ